MATPSTTNRPTPERIFTFMNAFQQTEALKTGIELDVFTAIGAGANTSALLAAKISSSERGVRILCDFLTIMGLLAKQEGRYSLTEESALFLDRRSPACLASVTGFLASPWHKKNVEALTGAVRKGGTAGVQGDNTKPQDDVWVAFARSMAPLTIPAANFIAGLIGAAEGKPCRVLDIAAGHGNYGITIAKKNPNAQIVAVDWPSVLAVAVENAKTAGVSDRYIARPGSAFETDLGTGYDFVLLTNIFHHFDQPTCEKLMRRVHAALKPGGKAVTLEFVPNEDRVTPPAAAAFSLNMLVGTDAGDAYTLSEYEKMFANAGFAKTTLHPVLGMPQQVLLSGKPE
ncbi:MAG TPA: class I SAM-dependent methyltransferase [Candidatus Acidoferrum sp.]|nr:class I SAM-dependent methyltransferase [Candidatus Acidoferrum sp.]